MSWTYQGKPFTIEVAEGNFGFTYCITCIPTGRRYIGKKALTFARSKKIKGSRRRKRFRVESDWQDYYGSNKNLLADVVKFGPDKFKREVLVLCKTRGECSYNEAKEQFRLDVIRKPDEFYNLWISCKISHSHLCL